MPTKTLAGTAVEVNDEGFFVDAEQWTKEMAPEIADEIGVPAADIRSAARLYATGGNAAIYYGLGVTEHSQGSTVVMAMANLAMATGNIGRLVRSTERKV